MCREGPKRQRLGGGWGKEIFDQLASHFPQFDQLLSYCVIKSWSIYDHFFIEFDQIAGQNDIINILRLLVGHLLTK